MNLLRACTAILRLAAWGMIAAAVLFLLWAFYNPQAGIPCDHPFVIYVAYIAAIALFFKISGLLRDYLEFGPRR